MTALLNIAEEFQRDIPEIVPPTQVAIDLSSARIASYNPWGYAENGDGDNYPKGRVINADGSLTLECQMDNGDEVETVYVPQHLASLAEYMFEVDSMQGCAAQVDGTLTLVAVSVHGMLQDGHGNYYDHETYKPVDKYGSELAA